MTKNFSKSVHRFHHPLHRLRSIYLMGAVLTLSVGSSADAGPRRNGFDLSDSSIPIRKILSGGPSRDGIPALFSPRFTPLAVSDWSGDERIIGILSNGVARAYPIAILNWHELVNDSLGGQAILVTYCPLCGTGMVFSREIEGRTLNFGVSGLLYQSDLLLYDHETESLWSQIASTAVTGSMLGKRLRLLRSEHTTLDEWKMAHPDSTVLSRATGYGRDYTRSPYENYAQSKKLHFPVPRDRRYHPKMLTLGVRVPGEAPRAYPSAEIERSGGSLVEKIGTGEISITYDSKRALFRADAPEGWELIVGYWFAWAAFHPDTTVFVFEPGRTNPD